MREFRAPNGRLWQAAALACLSPGETFENVKDRLRMTYIGPVVDTKYAQHHDLYMSKACGDQQYFVHDTRSLEGVYYLVGFQS